MNHEYLIHYGVKGMKWRHHKNTKITEEELERKKEIADPITNAAKSMTDTLQDAIDDALESINWNKPISKIVSDNVDSLKKDIEEIKEYGFVGSIKMKDLPSYAYIFAGSPSALNTLMKSKGDK